jgi:DNA-directed RNA polymerase specialized sigma24 family protein
MVRKKQKRWVRLTGEDRLKMTDRVAKLYARGQSIREISVETGRSYGAVHTLLREAGVTLRPRGNPKAR